MSYNYGLRYRAYENRFRGVGRLGLVRARLHITILDGTAASFNGDDFIVEQLGPTGILTPQEFQFYTGAPPGPGIIGVNIAGASSQDEIAGPLAAAMAANGWIVSDEPPDFEDFWVYQPYPGVLGNTSVNVAGGLDNLVAFNEIEESADGVPLFYDGQSLEACARFGRNYGLLPSAVSTPTALPPVS